MQGRDGPILERGSRAGIYGEFTANHPPLGYGFPICMLGDVGALGIAGHHLRCCCRDRLYRTPPLIRRGRKVVRGSL